MRNFGIWLIISQSVKIYYRKQIDANIKQIERILENRKTRQVVAFVDEWAQLFVERDDVIGKIMIDYWITNKTIGQFCGISSLSSITRIVNELVKTTSLCNMLIYLWWKMWII